MRKEFREFALRGDIVDLAVRIVIGASLGGIVSSPVAGVVMPPLGLLLGGVGFSGLFLTLRAGERPAGPDRRPDDEGPSLLLRGGPAQGRPLPGLHLAVVPAPGTGATAGVP